MPGKKLANKSKELFTPQQKPQSKLQPKGKSRYFCPLSVSIHFTPYEADPAMCAVVFFTNQAQLPEKTPDFSIFVQREPLKQYLPCREVHSFKLMLIL